MNAAGGSGSSSDVSTGCIVPHEVGQPGGRALGGVHVNVGGLKGCVGAWGFTSRGVRDGMGLILPRGLRHGTNVGGGPRVGPLGDRPRGALAVRAGSPKVAGVAPRYGRLGLGPWAGYPSAAGWPRGPAGHWRARAAGPLQGDPFP